MATNSVQTLTTDELADMLGSSLKLNDGTGDEVRAVFLAEIALPGVIQYVNPDDVRSGSKRKSADQ